MKKTKLRLDALKVNSFTTDLKSADANTIKGGTGWSVGGTCLTACGSDNTFCGTAGEDCDPAHTLFANECKIR